MGTYKFRQPYSEKTNQEMTFMKAIVKQMSSKMLATCLSASKRAMAILHGFDNRVAVEELCQKCGYARRFG